MAINLEEVDVNGAVQEAADRRLRRYTPQLPAQRRRCRWCRSQWRRDPRRPDPGHRDGGVLRRLASAPPAKTFGAGDIGVLNYALTLEYPRVRRSTPRRSKNNVAKGDKHAHGVPQGDRQEADEAKPTSSVPRQGALGSKAVKKPTFAFGKAVTDKATFAATVLRAGERRAFTPTTARLTNIKSTAKYLLVRGFDRDHRGPPLRRPRCDPRQGHRAGPRLIRACPPRAC